MRKDRAGFIIPSVLILGTVVTLGFFVSLAIKKNIDKETQLSNLQHTSYVVEDSLRTTVAGIAYDPTASDATTARNNAIAKIQNSAKANNSVDYVRMPIPNTSCNNSGDPCNVFIQSVKYISSSCDLKNTKSEDCSSVVASSADKAVLDVKSEYLDKTGSLQLKGAGIKEIVIPIPQTTEIQSVRSLQVGNLLCPISAPIFRGTEIVSVGRRKEIRAKCAAVDLRDNVTATCSENNCNKKSFACNTSAGYWLTGVNPDLTINCERFPAGTGVSSPTINLCPSGQVATGFNFDNKFNLSNVKCRAKGGPYDFER